MSHPRSGQKIRNISKWPSASRNVQSHCARLVPEDWDLLTQLGELNTQMNGIELVETYLQGVQDGAALYQQLILKK